MFLFSLSAFIFVPMFSSVREKRDIGQRIVLLENRLDGVMVQFNATLAQNTSVRKEIDHLVKKIRNLIFTLKFCFYIKLGDSTIGCNFVNCLRTGEVNLRDVDCQL
jgi:hypothetical protein